MHKKFVAPPDLNSTYEATPDTLEASIDSIIIADSDYATVSKLRSGTVRTDRKAATADELRAAKLERIERRAASNLARGSSDIAGNYEEGLELRGEAPAPFQKPAAGTVRTDN